MIFLMFSKQLKGVHESLHDQGQIAQLQEHYGASGEMAEQLAHEEIRDLVVFRVNLGKLLLRSFIFGHRSM